MTQYLRRCGNPKCGQMAGKLCAGRCLACYTYRYRHGRERDPENMRNSCLIEIPNICELYERYRGGLSMAQLATETGYSEETIRRRFRENGLKRRGNAGTKQKLTPAAVRQACRMAYVDGVPVNEIAEHFGRNYMTVHSAVRGDTWRGAGGPLPVRNGEHTVKCKQCRFLTRHVLCRWCRKGKR